MESSSGLSPELATVRTWAREFAERVLRKAAPELDQMPDPEAAFSWPLVEQASAIGLRTLTLAEASGGPGLDTRAAAAAVQEMAAGDMGFAMMIGQTLALIQLLQRLATPAQLAELIPAIRDDPRHLLAFAVSEPEVLSEAALILEGEAPAFATRAVPADRGWRINGEKHFVLNGNRAGLCLVLAQTSSGGSWEDGSTCFLVRADNPGVAVKRIHDRAGQRLANAALLAFDDCLVPEDAVLGGVGAGRRVVNELLPFARVYAAAAAVGLMRSAQGYADNWARTRVQGGKPIIEHGAVATKLAEIAALTQQAQHAVEGAAQGLDLGWSLEAPADLLAEKALGEMLMRVVVATMEIHGGYGFMTVMPIPKLARDALGYLHQEVAATSFARG